jgi:O-antigen/teichoic acid export membrane protein
LTRIAIIETANITAGPDRGLRRALSRGAAAAFALRACGIALTATAAVVLGHELGASGYGDYAWAFAWAMTLALPAALGADQLMVREAAVARDNGGWSELRSLVRSALPSSVAVALAAIAVAGLVIALVGGALGSRRDPLLIALPIVMLAAVTAIAQGALLGLGRTATALAPGTAGRSAAFLCFVGIGTAAGGVSAGGAVALQLAATAIATAAVVALLWRALPRTAGDAPHPVAPRSWLRVSVPMGAASMLNLVDAQVGLLMLGALGSSHATGVYAAALQCMAPFALVLTAVRFPLGPAIARLGAARDRARLQRGLRTATRAVAALCVLVAAVLVLFPGPILHVFGSSFSGEDAALQILAVAQLVNALCAFNGLVLIMNGEERSAMRAAFGSVVLDLALCAVLVPPLGARGAALAALAAITARNVANSVATQRRLGLDTTVLGRLRPTRR